MSRSVVIVNEDGRLVSTDGGLKESNAKYRMFANRLVGESGSGPNLTAAVRFGWNGSGTLVIAKGGDSGSWQKGDRIDVLSDIVSVSGSLRVGDKDLQDIIDDSLKSAFTLGIKGEQGEISVAVSDYSGSEPYAPKKICTIGLSPDILNRIDTLEREMNTSIPSSVVFGDGIDVRVMEDETAGSGGSDSNESSDDPSFRRSVSVRIGSGMKFEGDAGARAIAVDTVNEPKPSSDPDASKPITASGAYTIRDSIAAEYSETSTYTVGQFVYHESEIYQCTAAVTTPGPWSPAHWSLRALDDLFAESPDYADAIPKPTGKIKNTRLDQAVQIVLDERGAGYSLDDDVTSTSAHGVKSRGIWSFVKNLGVDFITSIKNALGGKRDYTDLTYEIYMTPEAGVGTWTEYDSRLEMTETVNWFENYEGSGYGAWIPVNTTVSIIQTETGWRVKASAESEWTYDVLPGALELDYLYNGSSFHASLKYSESKIDSLAKVSQLDDKRDKGDLAVYEVVRTENTDWAWTSENTEFAHDLNEAGTKPEWNGHAWWYVNLPSNYSINMPVETDRSVTSITYDVSKIEEIPVVARCTATRPRYMDETLGSAKTNQQLAAVATGDAQTPADGDLVKYDAANNRLAKAVAGTDYRNPQDNTCHKTELGEWVADLPAGYTFEQESTIHYDGNNSWSVIVRIEGFGPSTASATGPEDSTSLNFRTTFGSTFTATRTAVCSDGKRFVTEDFAAKKSDIFGNDGKPSDMFTTDLLRKRVAKEKVGEIIAERVSELDPDNASVYDLIKALKGE